MQKRDGCSTVHILPGLSFIYMFIAVIHGAVEKRRKHNTSISLSKYAIGVE